MTLVKRLQSEPQIVQMVQNFIALELDVGSNDFRSFVQKYKPPGNGIPMLFVVGPSGAEIDKISGAPQGEGLNTFLARSLSRSALAGPLGRGGDGFEGLGGNGNEGTEDPSEPAGPSEADLKARQRRLATLVRRAENFVNKRDFGAAAKIVGPLLDDAETPANPELERLATGLEGKANQAIGAADGRLDSGDVLLAAVALMEAQRNYGALRSVAPALTAARERILATADGEEVLRQAEAVDIARAAEAERDLDKAIAGYQAVIEKFPGMQVAQMSQARIGQLRAAQPAGEGNDLEKAESMYTMAQAIAQRDPDKAKKYLEKVIEIAPSGSLVSSRAATLLRQLN